VALKLSNVATFPSTLSKHSVNSVRIISTTFVKIQRARAAGKPVVIDTLTHSKRSGLNVDLAAELETNFASVPPLAAEAAHADEINKAFDSLEKEVAQEGLDDELEGRTTKEVLEGKLFMIWGHVEDWYLQRSRKLVS